MKWRDSRRDRPRGLQLGGHPRGLSNRWAGLLTRLPPRDGTTRFLVVTIRSGGDHLVGDHSAPSK